MVLRAHPQDGTACVASQALVNALATLSTSSAVICTYSGSTMQ
jgi:hypothetical protein